jgi:hypothetical protein
LLPNTTSSESGIFVGDWFCVFEQPTLRHSFFLADYLPNAATAGPSEDAQDHCSVPYWDPYRVVLPVMVRKPGSPNRSFDWCAAALGAIGFRLSSKGFSKEQRKELHEVTARKVGRGLDFGALRHAIEQCDPDLILGFYSEEANLSIVNSQAQRSSSFELCGKAEIAKHLRAAFGQETSHRVEGEVVGERRVTFREACKYPDGGRVLVETTLEVRDGKILRQEDVVTNDVQVDRRPS